MEGSPVYGYAGIRKVTGSVERWPERRKETRKQKKKKDAEEMLLEEIISKSNMRLAYQKVTGNKGAAGVDGIGVADFAGQLKTELEDVKTKLETGSYEPHTAMLLETMEECKDPNRPVGKLGIKPNQAYQWGNTHKGYWRTVQSPILRRAIGNAFLKKEGLISLKDIVTPLKTVSV